MDATETKLRNPRRSEAALAPLRARLSSIAEAVDGGLGRLPCGAVRAALEAAGGECSYPRCRGCALDRRRAR